MTYLTFDKTKLINLEYSLKREIIRTNRAGAYNSSTIINCNTRKYHGLLVCPMDELDGGRHVLLSSLDETVIQHNQAFNLGLHKYAGDNYEPKGHKYLRDFTSDPIPKLLYRVGGVILSKEILFVRNEHQLLIRYTLVEANSPTLLQFKPFLAFRNIHALSKANLDINYKYQEVQNGISSCLYNGYPNLFIQFSKEPEYVPAPDWNFNIEYLEEQKRGYEYKEDLYVPGYFEIAIKKGESIVFSAGLDEINPKTLKQKFTREITERTPRNNYNNCLSNASSQFFVNQENNTFIYAGYPWLPIRSRDMLIALPGFCLPNSDITSFKKVIDSVISKIETHLIPETFDKNKPTFSADVPLWLIWSLQQLNIAFPKENIWKQYKTVLTNIVLGYLNEEQLFNVNDNGLIYINPTITPSSWMNGIVNGEATVKRSGYLIEVNALWYNALKFINEICTDKKLSAQTNTIISKIDDSFVKTFWNEERELFADFVSQYETNMQIRPNQLFAFALPNSPVCDDLGRKMLKTVSGQLQTPIGIRSLSPVDPLYKPKYEGDHNEREFAAYNGSVWPWLMTFYFEANQKIQSKSAIRIAKQFLKQVEPEIQFNGLCSISELYDGDPAHEAKGCISFAKNTGEIQRLVWLISQLE